MAANRRSIAEFHTTTIFLRPANTTAYTAGNIYSNGTQLVFPDAVNSPGFGGEVRSILVVVGSNQALLPTFRLWLFDTSMTDTTLTDNIPFAMGAVDAVNLVGFYDLASPVIANPGAGAAGKCALLSNLVICGFDNEGGDGSLYGILTVTNAYIPTSGEGCKVHLGILAY